MGLIDFVRDAGERLAGAATDLLGQGESADEQIAKRIVEQIQHMKLAVSDVGVEVSGETAVVRGIAASHADRERAILVAGNVQGIAKVDGQITVVEPAGAKPSAPPARFYTVVSGDSLSKIAKAEYGDATKYPVIFEANRPMLQDPDKIYPGQVLRIPAPEGE